MKLSEKQTSPKATNVQLESGFPNGLPFLRLLTPVYV
jgi:hypothetical protein